jgi:hypothetical protein
VGIVSHPEEKKKENRTKRAVRDKRGRAGEAPSHLKPTTEPSRVATGEPDGEGGREEEKEAELVGSGCRSPRPGWPPENPPRPG